MHLRTTPQHYGNRDHEVFPALDLVCQRYGVPLAYRIEVTPMAVAITVGDFRIDDLARRCLASLYENYLDWWCAAHNQHAWVARELDLPGYLLAFRMARGAVAVPLPPGSLPGERRACKSGGITFRGKVLMVVLPEHAQWWIDLLNETASFLEERARLFPTREGEEEQARWEYQSLAHADAQPSH